MAPPRKTRTVAQEKTRRSARPGKPREASDDTAPQDVPRENAPASAKAFAETVRKKVIARLKRFHPMD